MTRAKLAIFLTSVLIIGAIWSYETTKVTQERIHTTSRQVSEGPPSVRMYDYLVKYSEQYDVPLQVALGIARLETGYKGPFHWSYNPKQVSTAGACGAMQIMPKTATYIHGKKVTKEELLNDLELNIEISMKYMARLHKRYGRWDVALGYYNTGTSAVNGYAMRIMKNV